MGSFADYRGHFEIPAEKKSIFVDQMCRLLNYGGMMIIDDVKMFGYEITLLKPIQKEEKDIHLFFNYFEDDSWESAGFDTETAKLWSGKIGDEEFSDVMACIS